MHINISLVTKFRLKLTLKFLDQINIKRVFPNSKKKENYHRILHIQINLDSKFQLQQFLEQIFKKIILPVEIRRK